MIHESVAANGIKLRTVVLRSVGLSALLLASGLPGQLDAITRKCATHCNGQYCWGDITSPGAYACYEGTVLGCIMHPGESCC